MKNMAKFVANERGAGLFLLRFLRQPAKTVLNRHLVHYVTLLSFAVHTFNVCITVLAQNFFNFGPNAENTGIIPSTINLGSLSPTPLKDHP